MYTIHTLLNIKKVKDSFNFNGYKKLKSYILYCIPLIKSFLHQKDSPNQVPRHIKLL